MRKHRLLVLLSLLLIGVGIGAAAGLWPCAPISPANYHRIQLGMSQEQVEAVIGLPPGDYYSGPRGVGGTLSEPFAFLGDQSGIPSQEVPATWYRNVYGPKVESWWGNDYVIEVAFDENGAAVGTYLLDVFPPARSPTLIDRLRACLGW